MTQQYIDFGSFPDDPSADSIRESFQKVQDNFTDLYTNALKQGVLEVVPGFGLRSEDDRITGNLVLYANIPNVTVTTPYTIENGLTNLRVKPRTSPSYGNIAVISDATPIDIDLAPNIKTLNANFTGNLKAANLQVYGKVQTDLLPEGDEILNLGSPSHRWKDLFLSGNTLTIGQQSISSNVTGFVMTGSVVTDSISVGTVEATTVYGAVTTTEQTLVTKLGTLSELSISGDTTSQGNLSLIGNLDSYAVNATTISVTGAFTAGTITGNIVLPPGATIDAPGGTGADMQIIFNDGGKQAAVPGLSYNKLDSLLTIQGNVEGGNLNTSGALAVTGAATVGSLATDGSIYANTGAVSAGSIISLGILTATDTITGGNVSTGGYLSVTGNASIGNITAVNSITGNVMSITGNISGANLVASGILKVDGNANVGNLTTSGLVSAATLKANAANINGDTDVSGNIVTINGKISGGTLYSSGLADITGDLLGRSNIQANGLLTVLGNSTLGNVSTSGLLSVTGNANIANLETEKLSVSGNVSGGNLDIRGILRAGDSTMANVNATSMDITGNHVAGNLATKAGGTLSVSGNSNLANVGTTGFISADGNITGANIKTLNATIFANGTFSGSGLGVGTGTISGGNIVIDTAITSNGNMYANTGTIQSDLLKGNSITIATDVTATTGNMYANSGMIKANVVSGNIANVTGNLESGNIKTAGTANVSTLIVTTGANVTGTANIQGTVIGTLFQGNGASLTNLNSTVLSTTITTTAASGTGSVVTLTYTSPGFIPFYQGQSITVSGLVPTAYNGTFTVATASATQVTFNHTATGVQTSAGTITGGSRALSATQADNAAQATVVTASSQPTITSLGTLTGLTLNGSGSISGAASISGGNVNVSSYFLHSLTTGITALGSTQGAAYVLTKEVNVVSSATASVNDGVQLPVPPASTSLQIIIINASSSAIKVYPSSGAQVDSNGTNTPAALGAGGKLVLFSTGSTQWYTLTTIYA